MIGKHEIPYGYYCGPSTLMALTGETYEKTRWAINQAMGRRDNAGIIRVKTEALPEAARFLGYEIVDAVCPQKPLPLARMVNLDGAWIVRSAGHFMAVFNGEVCENQYVHWTPIAESPSKRKRITHAWRIADATR